MHYNFFKISTFIILLLTVNLTFADTSIILDSNKIKINKWEQFDITINIKTDWTGTLKIINIDWLNEFQNLWQNRTSSEILINWEKNINYKLQLFLKSNNIWSFVIGPVKLQINDEIYTSNTVTIDIVNKNITNKESDNIIDDDIKPIKDINSWFYNFIFFQLVIITLLVGLYFYYAFIKNKKKSKKKIINNFELRLDENSKLVKKLKWLKKASKLEKSLFYEKLNSLFREYFKILWINNSDLLTLNELKQLDLNKILISLFEKSYLNEFNDKKDSTLERIEIIDKLIKIIK